MFCIRSSLKRRNMHFVSYSQKMSRSANGLGRTTLRALGSQDGARELRDRLQRRLRRLPMWRMAGACNDGPVNRAVALASRDLDLPHGAIMVVRSLQDRDRHTDIG